MWELRSALVALSIVTMFTFAPPCSAAQTYTASPNPVGVVGCFANTDLNVCVHFDDAQDKFLGARSQVASGFGPVGLEVESVRNQSITVTTASERPSVVVHSVEVRAIVKAPCLLKCSGYSNPQPPFDKSVVVRPSAQAKSETFTTPWSERSLLFDDAGDGEFVTSTISYSLSGHARTLTTLALCQGVVDSFCGTSSLTVKPQIFNFKISHCLTSSRSVVAMCEQIGGTANEGNSTIRFDPSLISVSRQGTSTAKVSAVVTQLGWPWVGGAPQPEEWRNHIPLANSVSLGSGSLRISPSGIDGRTFAFGGITADALSTCLVSGSMTQRVVSEDVLDPICVGRSPLQIVEGRWKGIPDAVKSIVGAFTQFQSGLTPEDPSGAVSAYLDDLVLEVASRG